MKSSARLYPKSLSPYAQALRHVALRGGAAALGPSARESELALYRRGALPADYRPMAHGKWDDTVERWAYAWQFPAVEEEGEFATLLRQLANDTETMQRLLAFGQRLLADTGTASLPHKDKDHRASGEGATIAPPATPPTASTSAPSAPSAAAPPPPTSALEAQLAGLPLNLLGTQLVSGAALAGTDAEAEKPSSSLTVPPPPSTTVTATTSSADAAAAAADPNPAPLPHVGRIASPSSTLIAYSQATGVPAAYLDDRSAQAAASKELCDILEMAGLDYTEDGLQIALSAMAMASRALLQATAPHRHAGSSPLSPDLPSSSGTAVEATPYYSAARAIFEWVSQLGLGPTAEMYKALMRHATAAADVPLAMSLVEEMKDKGITPRIGNWHELMQTLHRAGEYGAVERVVENMKMYANLEPNEITFALQLRALAKDQSNDFNALASAVQLFDQMEQVYGFIASRPHYNALLFALCQSPAPEMRLRCRELADKMALMGMVWDKDTYLYLIRSAQVVGDVEAVEELLGKMRDQGVPLTAMHLAWAVHAHTQRITRQFYAEVGGGAGDGAASSDSLGGGGLTSVDISSLGQQWRTALDIGFGIYRLVQQRQTEVPLPLLNALLRLCCQCGILAVEAQERQSSGSATTQTPSPSAPERDAAELVGFFEDRATQLWNEAFEDGGLHRDAYSYECYIALLAQQQRLDEAEKLFQELVFLHNAGVEPTRRTYESLVLMHLRSGEEGGAARALQYLEAMERSHLPVRASLLKRMVRVHTAAGYRRDMKRRARRIMQAREEFVARKAEGVSCFGGPGSAAAAATGESGSGVVVEEDVPHPLPPSPHSTFAWWQQWLSQSRSKHDLFDDSESPDGTPKGEAFHEKNAALAQLGIDSIYTSKADVPASSYGTPQPHQRQGNQPSSVSSLVGTVRRTEGSEMAGAIWALDGGELSYPKDGGGPEGFGVRLWRERQVVKKTLQAMKDGTAGKDVPALPAFSALGNAVRVVGDQLDIEATGAQTPGELSDDRRYGVAQRYDDGTVKPANEISFPVGGVAAANAVLASEAVWQAEQRDPLAPYKTDEELALESDNTFYQQLWQESHAKTSEVVEALREKAEQREDVHIRGRGPTRRSKYDYLEKWRRMYRDGTLDVSDLAAGDRRRPTATATTSSPLLRFGRSPEDHHETMANTVRQWMQRQRRQQLEPLAPGQDKNEDVSQTHPLPDAAQRSRWAADTAREQEARMAETAKRRRRLRRGGAGKHRRH